VLKTGTAEITYSGFGSEFPLTSESIFDPAPKRGQAKLRKILDMHQEDLQSFSRLFQGNTNFLALNWICTNFQYKRARPGLVSRQEAGSEILLNIPAPDRNSIFPKSSGSERIQIHIRYTTLPRNQQRAWHVRSTVYLQRTVHSRAPFTAKNKKSMPFENLPLKRIVQKEAADMQRHASNSELIDQQLRM